MFVAYFLHIFSKLFGEFNYLLYLCSVKREEKDSGRWTTEMRLLARAKLTSDIRNPTIRTE